MPWRSRNAVNYTPQGGVVSISVARRGFGRYGSVLVTIQDTGIGVPKDDLPRLFEPFYRGKNALPLRTGASMGLGLAIVREIADLHRADVEIRSEAGKGTVVAIKFGSTA